MRLGKAVEVGQWVPDPSGVDVGDDDGDAQSQEVLDNSDLMFKSRIQAAMDGKSLGQCTILAS